ncbi:hypothetical protein [Paenibacillus sp. NPDC058071]|uniref:hypothetical protein n=1 Tax=Paenibacillus sp. NPDC058071 TaxID=3346326 RepID=UPI0036DF90D2
MKILSSIKMAIVDDEPSIVTMLELSDLKIDWNGALTWGESTLTDQLRVQQLNLKQLEPLTKLDRYKQTLFQSSRMHLFTWHPQRRSEYEQH